MTSPAFSALMDALCFSYLGQGKNGLPGVRRLAVEAYVAALEARLSAPEHPERAPVLAVDPASNASGFVVDPISHCAVSTSLAARLRDADGGRA
jgi:hypothetical protein